MEELNVSLAHSKKNISNLIGQTPAEFFTDNKPKREGHFVSDWDGVLSGYYFPD